jgi:hypothetical protein
MNTYLRTKEKASALIVTLLVIFVITASIGIAVQLTTTTARQTDSSRDFSALRSAAEGALDFAYGIWAKTINNYYGPVSNLRLTTNMATVPSFTGFSYAPSAENGPLRVRTADKYGQPDPVPLSTATPPPAIINLDNYPGWIGRNSSYIASVRLVGTFSGGRTVKYGVKRAMNYSVVPLFQATAFFEDNLELYKTAPMTIGGLVHTNNHAYVSSSTSGSPPSLTFSGNLSYVTGYTDTEAPPAADTWSGYSPNSAYPPAYSSGGFGQQVNDVNRMEPLGADAGSLLRPPVDSAGNPTGDLNPNDDSMREMIELPDTSAYPDPTPIAQRRLSNKAGIVIRVTSTTTTITTQNGTSLSNGQRNALTNALSRQTIYDRREGKYVDVTTLNVSQAQGPLTAASGFNNILYIYDDTSSGYTDPKGIRLTNGANLPSDGLTVASQNPVYIQGDYNTGANRVSSAVFADAVTILSNNWNDSNSAGSLFSRPATSTTVNTAIVAGFLPSGWVNEYGVQYGYSGGLNNFPRFLEDWGNDTFTYSGSMIELFTSKIATGEWDTGNIYRPPNRAWNFESLFVDNPPPGSLDAVSLGRGALVRF